ncbi:hypothetical protein PVAP13_1KG501700 [Panicum virgatum]|uniref:Pentatricopeptide repeat-containing protein n=1 Tax=Panicum virgatum TaxID=38727 RepID=A0A8T0XIN5_PANVG|nr:hypothetical protein PVAP13_1KG501700 [Panicum virgatum]
MAACLLRPYPPGLPPSRADSNPASHQPTRLRWGLGRRRRRRHILRCVAAAAASTATLQRELLVLPNPRTEQSPGPANPSNVFDRMPDRSVATVPGAGNLLDERPRTKGKGAEERNRSGAPKGGEKSRSGAVVALAHAGKHEEVVEHFRRMRRKGVPVSRFVFPSVFRACAGLRDSRMLRAVHGLVIKCSLCQHVVVGTSLVDAYIDFGLLDDAKKVFNEIREPNVVSWSVIIGGYSRSSQWYEAWVAFSAMQHSGVLPNVSVLVMAIQASGALRCLVRGKQMHAMAVVLGFGMNATVWNCLIDMYGKSGNMELARLVFGRMDERNYVSWDALLSGYVENGLVDSALDTFRKMESANIKPNQHTFANLLRLCGDRRYKEYGRQIHGHAIKVIKQMNVVLETELIDMYAKCGCIEVSQLLFLRMNERNLISWNTLLSGYVGDRQSVATINIYRQMELACIRPDHYTLAGLLNLCRFQGLLHYGRQIHARLIKTGSEMNVVLQTLLVHMYFKCRRWRDAHNVCTLIRERNSHVYEAFFKVYGDDYLI